MDSTILSFDRDSFFYEISHSKAPVIVLFWTPWCILTDTTIQQLHQLNRYFHYTIPIGEIDILKTPIITDLYDIASVPYLLVFFQQQIIFRHSGFISIKKIASSIARAIHEHGGEYSLPHQPTIKDHHVEVITEADTLATAQNTITQSIGLGDSIIKNYCLSEGKILRYTQTGTTEEEALQRAALLLPDNATLLSSTVLTHSKTITQEIFATDLEKAKQQVLSDLQDNESVIHLEQKTTNKPGLFGIKKQNRYTVLIQSDAVVEITAKQPAVLRTIIKIFNPTSIKATLMLLRAIKKNNLVRMKQLLHLGVSPNSFVAPDKTALVKAIESSHLSIISYLIENGADVNFSDKNGLTPLMIASQQGKQEIVAQLISAGAQIDKSSRENETAFDLAVNNGKFDCCRLLSNIQPQDAAWQIQHLLLPSLHVLKKEIQHQKKVISDKKKTMTEIFYQLSRIKTTLLKSITIASAVQHALQQVSNNRIDPGLPAIALPDLHSADNCSQWIQTLEFAEAEIGKLISYIVQISPEIGATKAVLPLLQDEAFLLYNQALSTKQPELAELHLLKAIQLLPHEKSFHLKLAMHYESTSSYAKAIHHYQEFIKLQPDDGFSYYSLGHLSFKIGHVFPALEYLENALKYPLTNEQKQYCQRLSLDIKNKGIKALWSYQLIEAARQGRFDLVSRLLEKGADSNSHHYLTGATALILASQKGHESIVEILLRHGANPNLSTDHGIVALIPAIKNGYVAIVKLLIDNGADINAVDKKLGVTALIAAVLSKQLSITQLLIEKGARIETTMNNGDTALAIATRLSLKEFVNLLSKNIPAEIKI